MADIVASALKTYFISLTATHDICDELGTRFTFGSNLFIGYEPETTNCVTIIPYPGGPPSREGSRHESGLNIRVKMDSLQESFKVSQSIINNLHDNTSICTGKFSAIQSSPILLRITEGGEDFITVSNYIVKHVKL